VRAQPAIGIPSGSEVGSRIINSRTGPTAVIIPEDQLQYISYLVIVVNANAADIEVMRPCSTIHYHVSDKPIASAFIVVDLSSGVPRGGLGCSNPPPEILKISVESSIAQARRTGVSISICSSLCSHTVVIY